MTRQCAAWGSQRAAAVVPVIARCFVGGLYLYMGLNKALHPVEFLKLVRQYDLVHHSLVLNLIASALPWIEVFCGLLLVTGVAVRGTALMSLLMLVPFTALVLKRALVLQAASALPFCAIRFDCGCGAGEVNICYKIAENSLLLVLSAGLLIWRGQRLSLKYAVVKAG